MNVLATSKLEEGRLLVNDALIAEAEGPMDVQFRSFYQQLALEYPKFHKMDRSAKLAVLVTERLFAVAKEQGANLERSTGLIGSSNTGSFSSDTEHWRTYERTGLASPAVFVYTLPNIPNGEITIRHGLHGSSLCMLMDNPDPVRILTALRIVNEQHDMRHVICHWSDIFADRYSARALLVGPGSGARLDIAQLTKTFAH